MSMDQSVIDKIRKLLARGDEARNDNAPEREIAMRHAHALLAKHGLTLTDVGDEDSRGQLGRLGRQECGLSTKFVWEAGVWSQIAKLNGCKIVRKGGNARGVWVIGRELRGEVVKSMARYCVDSIIAEARRQGFTLAGFGYGAWGGIAQQVDRILADMEAGRLDGEAVSTCTALVLVSQHKNALVEAQRVTAEFFPNLRKGRGGSTRDHSGYSAGKAYGERISLNAQVTGGKAPAALTKARGAA